MKTRLAVGFLALSSWALIPASGFANSVTANAQDDSKDCPALTGCLTMEDRVGEYNLTAEDGRTWEVRSTTTKLHMHVGHTVTIAGKVWHPGKHAAREKARGRGCRTTRPNTATCGSPASACCVKAVRGNCFSCPWGEAGACPQAARLADSLGHL